MGVGKLSEKIKLWENWGVMGVLTIIIIGVLTIVFLLCELPSFRTDPTPLPLADPEMTRAERNVGERSDPCLSHYGGIEVDYVRGSTTAFTFDLCSVIKCGYDRASWRGYEVWICHDLQQTGACIIGHPTILGRYPCPVWDMVTAYTAPGWDSPGRWRHGFAIQHDFSQSKSNYNVYWWVAGYTSAKQESR